MSPWNMGCGNGALRTAFEQGASVLPKKEESGVLMVMNLPDSLTDEHVRELLSPFGELKRFNLLKVSGLRACPARRRAFFRFPLFSRCRFFPGVCFFFSVLIRDRCVGRI